MSIDPEELKKMLKKRSEESSLRETSPFEKMELKEKPGKAKLRKVMKTSVGEVIYEEERETTVNPYTLQPETAITYTTIKCGCGLPVTGEMLSMDQVKPCILCGKITCPRCRVNTDLREYLKPEFRGQPICRECWESKREQIYILCPGCGQPVRNYEDLHMCPDYGEMVCPACDPDHTSPSEDEDEELPPPRLVSCPFCGALVEVEKLEKHQFDFHFRQMWRP